MDTRRVITYQSSSYKVGCNTGASVNGNLNYPFHFVNRKTYDHYWLTRAQEAGVEFKAGEQVVSLDPSRKQITTASGRRFVGKFILGADGALSWTRRYLAAKAVMKSYSEPQEALTRYTRYLNRDIAAELKYIRLARQIIFSLPGNWTYRLLSTLLRTVPQLCEETVQGQRSYRWFRPISFENKKRNGTC